MLKFHSDRYAEKCLTTSPQATSITEEKAVDQYYRKTPEESDKNEAEPDRWEVCQTVIDKIKETSKDSKGIVPEDYQNFLEIFTSIEPTAPQLHRDQDHHIPQMEGKIPPYKPLRPLNEEKMRTLKEYIEVNEE